MSSPVNAETLGWSTVRSRSVFEKACAGTAPPTMTTNVPVSANAKSAAKRDRFLHCILVNPPEAVRAAVHGRGRFPHRVRRWAQCHASAEASQRTKTSELPPGSDSDVDSVPLGSGRGHGSHVPPDLLADVADA